MAFDEVQFPTGISWGVTGGPCYSTDIVRLDSGYEARNQNWSQALGKWDASHAIKTAADMATLIAFFRARKGRARGFRFKDWSDYQATAQATSPATGDGATAAFQLQKAYTSVVTENRTISKPVAEPSPSIRTASSSRRATRSTMRRALLRSLSRRPAASRSRRHSSSMFRFGSISTSSSTRPSIRTCLVGMRFRSSRRGISHEDDRRRVTNASLEHNVDARLLLEDHAHGRNRPRLYRTSCGSRRLECHVSKRLGLYPVGRG